MARRLRLAGGDPATDSPQLVGHVEVRGLLPEELQGLGGRGAVVVVRLQQGAMKLPELGRNVGIREGGHATIPARPAALLEPSPRHALVQDHADAEHVCPGIEFGARPHALRRHVAPLSPHDPVIRLPARNGRDAEVGELHFSGVADEDVVGRDVVVHDAERSPVIRGTA